MKKRKQQRAHVNDHSLQRRHREMQARALNLIYRAGGSEATYLFCTTGAVLEEGRCRIALLGPGERTLGQAPLQKVWEDLWYFDTHEFLRVLSLIPAIALELGRDVRDQGDQGAKAQLYELIPNVLIRTGYRRTLPHDDADVFLSTYAVFWLLRGYSQQSVTDDTRMTTVIDGRVLHEESPALDWGTTLPLPEFMALFPHDTGGHSCGPRF